MWLTDAATAARIKADQAALSHDTTVTNDHRANVAQVFAALHESTEFTLLLKLHDLRELAIEAPGVTGRSATTEGMSVLHFVVLRGCVARLLREADIVNWLARHSPANLQILQAILEVESLPRANGCPQPKPLPHP